jgi:hypothetical protein
VGQPIDCSDRDLCNGLETCVPATGACRPAAGPMLCAPGSRAEDKTCAAEWFVDDPNNPDGATGRVQSCRDGDASCDHDLDPTTCTLHVALCFRVPDPRLVPSCTPSDVAGFRLRQPSARRDPSAAAAMLAAIGTLPGATIDPRLPRAIAFSPPLSAVRCTAEVPLVVPLLGTKRLSGRTTTAGGSVDADSIRLRCLAP